MPESWARAVVRHRNGILAFWLFLIVAGAWASTQLPDRLATSFAVPGTDSHRAQVILEREFGERPDGTFTVVFRVPRSSDPAVRAQLQRRLAAAARVVPTGRARKLESAPGILFGEVVTTLPLHLAKRHTNALRSALESTDGPPAFVTGHPAIQRDLDPVFSSDLRRGEAIALPIALAVLLAVLGPSLAVGIPFLFAAGTIGASLLVLLGIAQGFSVAGYVPNIVVLLGLGIAIDYSLLIVLRFREELGSGLEPSKATARTMATAGRTIVFSGLTVALGLGLLLFLPVPLIRSLGVGGILVALVSVAAALTLQPALLSISGRRIGRGRELADKSGFWERLAVGVMRRPALYLASGTAVLLAAATPALFLELTPGSFAGIPRSLESMRGFDLLRERIGAGAVTPTEIVVDAGSPGVARLPPTRTAIDRLADRLFHDREVYIVASGRRDPYTEPGGRYARVVVIGRHEYGDEPTRQLVGRIRDEYVREAGFPPGVEVTAGGVPPQGVDFLRRSYAAFPWLLLAVVGLTYLLLLRAFRSLLVPLKAVLLNALTVAAACGLLVVLFQWGWGPDALGFEERGEIEGWIPIFLFAAVFGLSMDYEVFLVTRMREIWDREHDNTQAVALGLARTGRIITAAAVIMVAAFSGFAVGRIAPLQEFGVGLAIAVILDVTIVRAILVPSFMALLGRYNWWLPSSVARIVRVAPSPLVGPLGPPARSGPQ